MIPILAWRNIWRSPTRSLVVITAIALGVWAAISLSGFATGMMKSYVSNAVQNVVAHIQIHEETFLDEYRVQYTIPDITQVEEIVHTQEGVKAASTRTIVSGMVASSKSTRGVIVKGIKPEAERLVSTLADKVVEGEYLSDEKRSPLLISRELATKLNVKIRSKVVLTFQDMDTEITSAAFRIIGIYDTGNGPFDQSHVFIRQSDLNTLLLSEDNKGQALAHEIALLVEDVQEVSQIAADLQNKLPDLSVQTYREVSPDLELYESQITSISLIYLFIIMLALVFGIINTMLMAVLERLKELGMLMAIGMNKLKVFGMIVLEAILLGVVAAPIGLLLGHLTVSYVRTNGLDMSAYSDSLKSYGLSQIIYFDIDPAVYWQAPLFVFVTAVLAALYPAFKAIRLKPVEALRSL
jgi:putative ABC transport system permease protein